MINRNEKMLQGENSVEILKSNVKILDEINSNLKKDKLDTNGHKVHVYFGIRYQMRRLCCRAAMSKPNEQKKLSVYHYMKRYMEERMDVLYYLESLKKMDQMCSLLFNQVQNSSFEFLKHTNPYEMYERNLMESLDKERKLKELIRYFKERIQSRTMDSIDNEILKNIKGEILSLVNSNDKE